MTMVDDEQGRRVVRRLFIFGWDCADWMVIEEGDYVLLGRRDHQIKSRGYRIELGEIETAIYMHPDVQECAVLAVPDPLVTNRIHAFVVGRDGLTERDVVRLCGERVPHYMVPERVELVDALPKTSTGKVDRRALASLV